MAVADKKISGGFILLSRLLLDSELFVKPPHYLKLWIWILLKARWQDGDGLKRGQVRTSIREMQRVGLHKVGNRITGEFSTDQVRAAYGWLKKTGAIEMSETNSGLIISVMNYDTYQLADNYVSQNPNPTWDTIPNTTPNTTATTEKMLTKANCYADTQNPNPTPDTIPKPARTPLYIKEGEERSFVAPPSAKRPPSGDHQLFISWWHYAFEKTQGRPYLFAAKDAKAVKSLLTIHPLKHLVLAACYFLTVDDTFLNNRRDLPMLLSQINRMPGSGDPAHNGGVRYRAAGLLPPEGVKLENWRFYDTTTPLKEASNAA